MCVLDRNSLTCSHLSIQGADQTWRLSQGILTPGQGILNPGHGILTPGQGIRTPGQGILTPGQGILTPGQGILTPGQGIQTPGQGIQTPDQVILTPGQGALTPGRPLLMLTLSRLAGQPQEYQCLPHWFDSGLHPCVSRSAGRHLSQATCGVVVSASAS